MTADSRRSRRALQLTLRDRAALTDLVRFGPLRLEQIARRHFPSRRAARDRLARLVADGQLARGALGTYRATVRGTRSTGLPLPPPGSPNALLPHHLAVFDLACWLLARESGSEWITERELRRDATAAAHARGGGVTFRGTEHVPDGKLVTAEHVSAAIELELTAKPPAEYERICRWFAQAMAFDRFRWYAGGPAIERRLQEAAERHDLADLMSVELLPPEVRVVRWGA
jgi:hypothetical protein